MLLVITRNNILFPVSFFLFLVYLTAMLEYLAAEILELTGNTLMITRNNVIVLEYLACQSVIFIISCSATDVFFSG
jgi:hypothetical protein